MCIPLDLARVRLQEKGLLEVTYRILLLLFLGLNIVVSAQDLSKELKTQEFRCSKEGAYGVATISRMLKNIGLFCKRALQKRPIFCKETYIFKHPTHRSHPILEVTYRILLPLFLGLNIVVSAHGLSTWNEFNAQGFERRGLLEETCRILWLIFWGFNIVV